MTTLDSILSLRWFSWPERYARGMIKLGSPPSEFRERKDYDAEMDRLLDMAIVNSLRDCRRYRRYAWLRGWAHKWGMKS